MKAITKWLFDKKCKKESEEHRKQGIVGACCVCGGQINLKNPPPINECQHGMIYNRT